MPEVSFEIPRLQYKLQVYLYYVQVQGPVQKCEVLQHYCTCMHITVNGYRSLNQSLKTKFREFMSIVDLRVVLLLNKIFVITGR